MTSDWLLLVLYVGGALLVSFLCSILEAALLSIDLGTLYERRHEGDDAATRLLDLKQNRLDDGISAILTLNTIAHTIGATLAGAQAAAIFGDAWVGAFSAVLTLLVLVLTEIIPKTLGSAYANELVPFVNGTVRLLVTMLWPIIRASRAITRLLSRGGQRKRVSRGELAALVALAHRQGTLRGHQPRLLENALKFDRIRVEDVMTPRPVVAMLHAERPRKQVLERGEHTPFSRLLLFEDSRDRVTGYVLLRDVLQALAEGEDPEAPLSLHRRDVLFVPAVVTVARALTDLLEKKEHLAVAVDEFGGLAGVVTLEDCIETLLGKEVTDELDTVADLREAAAERRDRRLKRLGLTLHDLQPPASGDEPGPG